MHCEKHVSPQWARWIEPSGGFLIWLELKPSALSSTQWRRLFAAHGMQPLLGEQFFLSGRTPPSLRLSISMLGETEISEGIRRLGAALSQAYDGGQRRPVRTTPRASITTKG